MSDRVQERVNRYLQDAIAAERNFEDALASFDKAGSQPEVQGLFTTFSAKARTQHERLTAALQSRGGTPSKAKTVLAELLAFSPLSAQVGHTPEEKNTQHLIVVFAAAAAEMAMYEALASAAETAGDQDIVLLAQQLQKEEHDDYTQTWALLGESASSAFREANAEKAPGDVIKSYLQDVIAAEKTFESQLEGFAKESTDPITEQMYRQHAAETREQYEQLTARLEALGGSTSTIKTVVAHVFGFAPKIAQLGHDSKDRQTQNLMMAYAVENAEVATYEALKTVSIEVGDLQTKELAQAIQDQERATAEKIWSRIAPAARAAESLAE